MFCLVAIYAVIGEDLKPHLSQLASSKVSFHIPICSSNVLRIHTLQCTELLFDFSLYVFFGLSLI